MRHVPARVQALIHDSDEPAAWQVADMWLQKQHEHLPSGLARDSRPPWLRRYWQGVDRRASDLSRFPRRPA